MNGVILDLLGGARSLGELDFARQCRERGLPEPTRQVVRRGRDGRYYLDVAWEEWGVVVEIGGIHHTWAVNVVGDALRDNDVTLQDVVVRDSPCWGSGWPRRSSSTRSSRPSWIAGASSCRDAAPDPLG